MNLEHLNPPADLLAEFDDMPSTIASDATGARTRRLVAYFKQAQALGAQAQLRTTEFEERRFAGLVSDAFGAAHRIVLAAWQSAHGQELAA